MHYETYKCRQKVDESLIDFGNRFETQARRVDDDFEEKCRAWFLKKVQQEAGNEEADRSIDITAPVMRRSVKC